MITQLEQGILPEETEWKEYIDSVKNDVPAAKMTAASISRLRNAIVTAVHSRIPKEKFGIFFSGGVDSTCIAFLCKQVTDNFVCYTVGLKDSPDIVNARKVAKTLHLHHQECIVSLDELEVIFKKVAKLYDSPDTLKLGVGSVVFAAGEMAVNDGVRVMFGGLGSEEIFAGYQRHAIAKDVHGECWQGLRSMWSRDFSRDVTIAKALGLSFRVPFLDDAVIRAAMCIPPSEKIDSMQKKIVLRKIAELEGLPVEFCWRKKQAAQYGSWFDKALSKLAKRRGCASKNEYVHWLKEH